MLDAAVLPFDVVLRSVTERDAPALVDALVRNKAHLLPFESGRPDSFRTLDGQRNRLRSLVEKEKKGTLVSRVMVRDNVVLGYASLNAITSAPVYGASLGYWVDAAEYGRGLATSAVGALLRIADEDLGLHRIEAGTSPSNVASQRVLTKNEFEQFGTARSHLWLDGRWQDSYLFERLLNDRPPPSTSI